MTVKEQTLNFILIWNCIGMVKSVGTWQEGLHSRAKYNE